MNRVRGLCGAVAGLAVGAATLAGELLAGDLPASKAAPVHYVRMCSAHGEGFFSIPGTETCLRIGGSARAEILAARPDSRKSGFLGLNVYGRVGVDSYTATAYDDLHTFISVEANRNTGVYEFEDFGLDQAFIQFGGLTAGRATSSFAHPDLPTGEFGTLRFADSLNTNVLAYTYWFSDALSATLSLEGRAGRAVGALPHAGEDLPDGVGNVKYTGDWGSLQLSGALARQQSGVIANPDGEEPIYSPSQLGMLPDSVVGWAVTARFSVNLPMLADEDALWFVATYADGALGYLGFEAANEVGLAAAAIAEAYVGSASGRVDTGRGWQLAGGLTHYWTFQVRQGVFGSYAAIDHGGGNVDGRLNDLAEWRVGSNVIWTPVAGLDIGVEALYADLDTRGRFIVDGASYGGSSTWEGRLRIQHDF